MRKIKIVEIFKERNFPSGSIEHIENKDNLSSGVYYEIYRISNDYSSSIEFIYFSKHTVQHKTLENLVNNKTLTFTIEEKEYEGTIENIYDYLNGCL